jgi:hypothetical protein
MKVVRAPLEIGADGVTWCTAMTVIHHRAVSAVMLRFVSARAPGVREAPKLRYTEGPRLEPVVYPHYENEKEHSHVCTYP